MIAQAEGGTPTANVSSLGSSRKAGGVHAKSPSIASIINCVAALSTIAFSIIAGLLTACGGRISISGTPTVTWAAPAEISYGNVLSESQLNATADVAGTFHYAPTQGTLLPVGTHVLAVTFTPADKNRYVVVTASVSLTVQKALPTIDWRTPDPIPFGTPLNNVQLDARASVPGSFSYEPVAGTVLDQGEQVLSATFMPTDGAKYSTASSTVKLKVDPALPITLSLTSHESAVQIGKSTRLAAIALYSDGNTIDATEDASYTALPEEVVRLTQSGDMTCLKRGTVQVTASLGSIRASTNLICTQVVHQQPFSTLPDEFVGPFANWYDVRAKFGAKGDGVTDDTASIQKGLDAISTNHDRSDISVLWFPAGFYRITGTLTMASKDGVSIIGEDPTTTTVMWNGPAGGTMFFANGVARTRILRLTLDGAGIADTGFNNFWDGKSTFYPAWNSVTDMIFKDMKYALRIGFAGPTLVERVHFVDVSSAAISEEDWNAGELWVRDSLFQGCRVGITNINGAGQFNAYGNVFVNSTKADIYIGNPQFFSLRGNTSIGSNTFFLVIPGSNTAAQMVIQDNLIVDPASSPISLGNHGPLMLIDNTILLAKNATFPVIVANDFGYLRTDVFTMGNTYTTSNVLSGNIGRSMSIDDHVTRREEFSVEPPIAAQFLPNLGRKVIDVPNAWTTVQIQQALNDAGAQNGSHTALHFVNGYHALSDTLTISGGSDVQLIGDGFNSSVLKWVGKTEGPMLLIEDPAHATVRDLGFNGWHLADAIEVKVNDTPGSRVLLAGIVTQHVEVGVVSEGLDQAAVEARGTSIGGLDSVKIVGGISGQSKATTFGGYRTFGTGDESEGIDGYTYDVKSGGQLVVEDQWRDATGASPNFVHLTDSGTVSLECGLYASSGTAAFSIDGFSGDVSLLGYQEYRSDGDGKISVSGDASRLRFLVFGVEGDAANFFENTALGGDIGFVMNILSDHTEVPDQGRTDADFVRSMFSHVRHLHTVPLLPSRFEQTNVRFDHVISQWNKIGIHLVPSVMADRPVQSYSIESPDAVTALSGSDGQTLSSESPGSSSWKITHLDDGGYQIADIITGHMLNTSLALDVATGTAGHSWVIEPIGNGYFSIRDLSSGLSLSLDESLGSPTPAMLPEGLGKQEWKLAPVF